MNEIQPLSPLNASSAEMSSLMLELAKCLKLVAPTTMSADSQSVWLQAAVDALDGIRAAEVAAVSLEIRRSVTRVHQIIPEIAKLVHARRAKTSSNTTVSPYFVEKRINGEEQRRRAAAKTQREINEADDWARSERKAARIGFVPYGPPLNAHEIAAMPAHIRQLGLRSGFLKRDGERIVERISPEEIDAFREEQRKKAANSTS